MTDADRAKAAGILIHIKGAAAKIEKMILDLSLKQPNFLDELRRPQ